MAIVYPSSNYVFVYFFSFFGFDGEYGQGSWNNCIVFIRTFWKLYGMNDRFWKWFTYSHTDEWGGNYGLKGYCRNHTSHKLSSEYRTFFLVSKWQFHIPKLHLRYVFIPNCKRFSILPRPVDIKHWSRKYCRKKGWKNENDTHSYRTYSHTFSSPTFFFFKMNFKSHWSIVWWKVDTNGKCCEKLKSKMCNYIFICNPNHNSQDGAALCQLDVRRKYHFKRNEVKIWTVISQLMVKLPSHAQLNC